MGIYSGVTWAIKIYSLKYHKRNIIREKEIDFLEKLYFLFFSAKKNLKMVLTFFSQR